MIVIEGCDGTGKTTLVNQLSDELGLRVGLRGTPNRDELYKVTREDTYRALAGAVEGYYPPLLWDRLGPFSDPIYTRVDIGGRECAFKVEEMRHCIEVMKAIRVPIIICSVPLETARENAMMGHQMQGVGDHFDLIWDLYERFKDVAVLEFGATVYNYTMPGSYDKVKEHIQGYLTRRKDREWH